jgi:hypothetical protein
MDNQNTPSISLRNQQLKDKDFHTAEKKKFLQYLFTHTATCSMVCKATGINQKNATRHKRALQQAGLLAHFKKDVCELTGCKAWYLTTNPALFKAPTQLKIL